MSPETSLNISNAARVIHQSVKYYQIGDPLLLPMQSLSNNDSLVVFVEDGFLKIERIGTKEKAVLGEIKEFKNFPAELVLEKIETSLQNFLGKESLQVSAGLEGKVKQYKESSKNFSMLKFISAVKNKREDLIIAQIPFKTSNLHMGTDQIVNAFDKYISEVGQPINYEYLEKFELLIVRKGKSLNENQVTLYSSRLIGLPKVRIFHHFKHGVLQNKLEEYLEIVKKGEKGLIEALRKLFFKDKGSSDLFEEKIKKIVATVNISWDENSPSQIDVFNKFVNFRDNSNDLEGDSKNGFRLKFSQANTKAKGDYFFDIKSSAFISYLIALLIAGDSLGRNEILLFKNKFSSLDNEENLGSFAEELAASLKKLRDLAEKSLQENAIEEYNAYKDKYCKEILKILCLCLSSDEEREERIPQDFFITEGSLNALAKTFFLKTRNDG